MKNTKIFRYLLIICLVFSMMVSACVKETKKFTVTFDSKGGSSVESQTIEDGKTATEPANPTKSGFVFEGWFESDTAETAFKFTTKITGNLTLIAKWKEETAVATKFTVTVENGTGGGEFEEGTSVTVTATVPSGKEFSKWVDADGETISTANPYTFELTADITLVAEFVDALPKLATPSNKLVSVGETNGTLEIERGEGERVFDGAMENVDSVLVYVFTSKDATEAIATFVVDKNTISSVDGSITFTANEAANSQYAWQGAGNYYIFTNDVQNFLEQLLGDDFSNSATYYFKSQLIAVADCGFADSELSDFADFAWQVPAPTVTFVFNNGTANSTVRVLTGEKVEIPTEPTRGGFTFGGWYVNLSDAEPFDFDTAINADLTLTAKWVADTDKLQTPSNLLFSVSATTNNLEMERGEGELVFDGAVEGLDYVKVFIYKDGVQVGEFNYSKNRIWNGDLSFVATQAVDSIYQYAGPGNYFIMANHFESFLKSLLGAEYDGTAIYSFKTQLIAIEGSGFSDSDLSDFSAVGFRAIKTVTFNSNGGSQVATINAYEGATIEKPVDPTKPNNTFEGWFTDAGFTTEFNFVGSASPTLVSGNITLFAKWQLINPDATKDALTTVTTGFMTPSGSGNWCYDRQKPYQGNANGVVAYYGANIAYIKVFVYDGNGESANLLTTFKVVGNTLSKLDGSTFTDSIKGNSVTSITYSTAYDNGYNGTAAGNRWVTRAHFTAFLKDTTGNTTDFATGKVLYFKFQLIAAETGDYVDGEISEFMTQTFTCL